MEIRKADGWFFHTLSDGCGVAYNPFTGNLHALPPLSARLFEVASVDRTTIEKLVVNLKADFPEEDPLMLLQQSELHVSSMIELGIFSPLADSTNSTEII